MRSFRTTRRKSRPRIKRCFESLERRELLTVGPFTVTNTNDSGPGSLRQAIIDSNSDAADSISIDENRITFAIPGSGVQTIKLASGLPTMLDAGLTVDGTTQTDANAGNPLVLLDGENAGNADGLSIAAASITVNALMIENFAGDAGIALGDDADSGQSAENCVIENCEISGNSGRGMHVAGSGTQNQIVTNQISGNGQSGVEVQGNNSFFAGGNVDLYTTVQYNSITDNGFDGVFFNASGYNVADNNNIEDNGYASNHTASPYGDGVEINFIAGGHNSVTNNTIWSNAGNGVTISGDGDTDTVQDNEIEENGGSRRGDGVNVHGHNCTVVGNTIDDNSGNGISVTEGSYDDQGNFQPDSTAIGNILYATGAPNLIYNNGGLGINLIGLDGTSTDPAIVAPAPTITRISVDALSTDLEINFDGTVPYDQVIPVYFESNVTRGGPPAFGGVPDDEGERFLTEGSRVLYPSLNLGNGDGDFAFLANGALLPYITCLTEDVSSGASSDLANVSEFSSVFAINVAPTLKSVSGMILPTIQENTATNPGTLVASILNSASGGDPISDVVPGALQGIAVTAVDNTDGDWQYSIDNGANWSDFGSPSEGNARLLASDNSTRIRFVPNANFVGTVNNGITFRAWDQTDGANGGTGFAAANGGTNAFSSGTDTASITVMGPVAVTAAGSFNAVRGTTFNHAVATFTDPNGAVSLSNYSATVNWGDGQTDTAASITGSDANGVFTVSDSHRYSQVSSGASVSVVLHRTGFPDAAPVTDTVVVLPSAVAAHAVASFSVARDASFTHTIATFIDPNGNLALSNYSASVDWGDGQTDTATVISGPDASGIFTVTDSHSYGQLSAGETVAVTIHRQGAPDAAAVTDTIVVAPPQAVLVNGVDRFAVTRGMAFNQTVATFTDPGGALPLASYSATLAWGDGQTDTTTDITGPDAEGVFTVVDGHKYDQLSAGELVTVTVHRNGSPDAAPVTDTIVVQPSAVSAGPVSDFSVVRGADFTNAVATFTDPNGAISLSNYSATVDWGDDLADLTTNISGPDASGVFTINDSHTYSRMSAVETVTVTVHRSGAPDSAPVTDTVSVAVPSPLANNDTFVLGDSGTTSSGSGATSVLANDVSRDGQQQSLTATMVSTTSHGSLTLNPDGSFSYKPDATFQGIDRFTYTAGEGSSLSAAATVTLLSYRASLVDKLYKQVLGRPAEDAGLLGWTEQLDSGTELDVVAEGIFLSFERLDPLITQFYQNYLNRAPQPGDLAFWGQKWQEFQDPRSIVLQIVSSPEFLKDAETSYGGGAPAANDDYVKLLYMRLLDRPASASDLAFWDPKVQPASDPTQASMSGVAAQFYGSHEQHSDLVVDFLFKEYFEGGTAPDPTPYISQLDDGATQTAVELKIINSSSYADTPSKPAAGTVGRALYEHSP